MRKLKFRAWDKVENKMLFDADPFALHVSGSNEPIFAKSHKNENCIFEQYTGLKDKNGKEIYEGDIVQIDDHILGDFEVVWQGLGWKIKRATGYETLYVHKSEDCTVIGNIHENPELLDDKE